MPILTPDVTVDIENIPEGQPCIESRYDSMINAPHVSKLAKKAEADGFDGIYVSDMDFCGVEATREVVDIPIIGGFEPSAYTAMLLAQRFSIITIVDSVVDMQREHTKTFGITENLASIRVVHMSVTATHNHEEAIEKVFIESCKAIEEDGARAIILGCTGFAGIAQAVQKRLAEEEKRIPVMDPNCTAVSYLILLIRNNLSQSRLTYFRQS
jgi:allantoin racemase